MNVVERMMKVLVLKIDDFELVHDNWNNCGQWILIIDMS